MNVNEIKSILSSDPVTIDINDITEKHKFRLRIKCDNVYFETFFVPSEIRKIYVCLTAVAANIKDYPVFQRASWVNRVEGAILCIDDPTRKLIHHEFSTYFYGSNNKSCVNYIVDMVNKFCNLYNIETSDVYFISNSNGGFGAISCCDLLEGSNCLVFNANVNIPLWQKSKSTNNITHDSLFQSVFNVNFNDERYRDRFFLDRIIDNKLSKFYLYYNIASQKDKEQLEWLCNKIDVKFTIGIQQISNVFFHVDNINSKHPHPHHIFPNESVLPIVEDIMKYGITKTGTDALRILSNYMRLFYKTRNELFNMKDSNNIKDYSKYYSAKYRHEHEPFKGNKILVYKKDGSSEIVEQYENINVIFTGDNSLIVIHEPIIIKKRINIKLAENGYIEIFDHVRVHSMAISFPAKNSTLIINKGTTFEANTTFSAATSSNLEIILGADCMIAPNVTFRACDGHAIFSIKDNSKINEATFGIHVGNHVWIAEGADILKDVEIPDNCIIARKALVTSHNFLNNSIIAGIPARTIKTEVNWSRHDFDFFNK